jgi:hypothetical protein
LPGARPIFLVTIAIVLLVFALAARADDAPEMVIHAALAFDAPQIQATAVVRWQNTAPGAARTARFVLFANRFRDLPETITGLSRHLLVAGADFRPGGTEVTSAQEGDRELATRLESPKPFPPESILAVDLGREVESGERVVLTLHFRTRLPNLYDVLSATDGLVVAADGWYPAPLALDAAPSAEGRRPLRSSVRGVFVLPGESELVANGKLHRESRVAEVAEAAGLSFVLSDRPFAVTSMRAGSHRAVVYIVPSRETRHRVSHYATAEETLLDTLPSALADSAPDREAPMVRIPLRWVSTAPAEGMVLVSDRLFEIYPLLRPLHQRELAYALALDEEVERARAREDEADARWIAEGLAWRRAERLYRERYRSGREVRDYIQFLNVFAIVDRFETAPRIPFVRAFFPAAASDDDLRIRAGGAAGDRPPGRVVFDKLEARLRPEKFASLLADYQAGDRPFRDGLREVGGRDAEAFLDAWLRPYGAVNYGLADVEMSKDPARARFTVTKEMSEPRPDTVEVELAEADGTERHLIDIDRESAAVDVETRAPAERITLDPDRKATETRLDDNRSPADLHFLLDSADVEVSSTEFGISSLLVARRRYDYRKDLAVAAFITSRAYGGDFGFQLHGGRQIDANLFAENLFAYYALQKLDEGFRNPARGVEQTSGRLAGFGLRFNSYDTVFFENPSASRHVRLFFDGFDRTVASDFDYVQGGGSLAVRQRIFGDTILAGQVLNGFSGETGTRVPNQGLFSLGGFRSIRGIGAEEELAKNIFMVRAEVRQMLPVRLNLDFEEVAIARRLQLKAFVDAGRVENSVGRLYDPSGFAVGVGGGVNLFYDFMGFFPYSFYLDVATRADRPGSVQVLFGAGQPF